MDSYVTLNDKPDEYGQVTFIANKTKGNFVRLPGDNDIATVDCLHTFIYKYGIWDRHDKVVSTKKHSSFVPDRTQYNDISFVLNFYNMACSMYQKKNTGSNQKDDNAVNDTANIMPASNPTLEADEDDSDTESVIDSNDFDPNVIDSDDFDPSDLARLMEDDTEDDENSDTTNSLVEPNNTTKETVITNNSEKSVTKSQIGEIFGFLKPYMPDIKELFAEYQKLFIGCVNPQ